MGEVAHLEYVTRDGDRWDLIAWRFYGDPHRYEPILRANPGVPIRPVLDGGVRLLVPVLATDDLVPAEDLPPWKRGRP